MWRVMPGQALRQRAWGDQHVVYNDLSGDTHLLNADAMRLLLALRPAALDEASLVAELCRQLDLHDDPETAQDVALTLAELARLSLIEKSAC